MSAPRIRDRAGFFFGLWFVGLGVFGLLVGKSSDLPWVFLAGGAVRVVLSFLVVYRVGGGRPGPGPLSPTPARRFRATGWPPSKDPDDYR